MAELRPLARRPATGDLRIMPLLEGRRDLRPGLPADPFAPLDLHEVQTIAASKALAKLHGPSIIVSASGMASGGRVLHHLARTLPDPRNAVLLVGFQAFGTRATAGRR